MSTALYRLYRPQQFKEVEGQASAVGVLIKSVSTGRAAHAYLFSGARGCGKTTVARLMAKSLNCTSPIDSYEPCCKCSNCISIANGENLDVIEIDGASNNGVEEIRELKSHVSLAPFNSKFKIYIIDEVHMLSTAAFNALLKTLEEPPEYVIFILATTEPHKIPVTIRSRCQHIPFHRIQSSDILNRLEYVCGKENLEYENEALWEIARQADGALRDALSLLDQVMSFGKGKILLNDVSNLVGGGSLVALQRWLSVWRVGGSESFLQLNDMFKRGASPQRAIEEIFYISRNLWIAKEFGHECIENADVSKDEYDYIVEECKLWESKSLENLMLFLAKLLPQVRMGMRADVIVGILMSRRQEIMNNVEKKGVWADDQLSPSGVRPLSSPGGPASTKPAVSESSPSKKSSRVSKPVESEVIPAETDSRFVQPVVTQPFNRSDFLEKENFKPLSNEIREKFLLDLKSKEFAYFCALLDSEFFHNQERNEICIIVKHNYLFHFLSNDRNFLTLNKIIGTELRECKLKIVFEGKLYQHGEIKSQNKNIIETAKPEPTAPVIEPPSDKKVENTGSSLYDAACNVIEYMRGEIVMHRVVSDKTEEIEVQ